MENTMRMKELRKKIWAINLEAVQAEEAVKIKMAEEAANIGKEKKYLPMSAFPKFDEYVSPYSITIYYNGKKGLKWVILDSADDTDMGMDYAASFHIGVYDHRIWYRSSRGFLYWDKEAEKYMYESYESEDDDDEYESEDDNEAHEVVGYAAFLHSKNY